MGGGVFIVQRGRAKVAAVCCVCFLVALSAPAVQGFDLATGWGVPNGEEMLSVLREIQNS
jgi:hypothetical protein